MQSVHFVVFEFITGPVHSKNHDSTSAFIMHLIQNLSLHALLLGGDDLETSGIKPLGWLHTLATLLRDFAPSPTSSSCFRRCGRASTVENALVSEFTTAKELLCKMARIQSVGGRMYRFSYELDIWWEAKE